MKSKLLLAATAASALMLAGCANNAELEAQISALSNKVENLTSDQARQDKEITAAKRAAANAQRAADDAAAEAMRANQRIDNIAESYRK
ncbi:hypothetical protein FCL40_13500 [Ferrimonas sediminicola]|uniref:Major outer membrane lipoprotein Lpp n=1 Tax=Ferrimonas sediminicola TaxID=2569538 RepID=A0A4V5NUX0_9GAMM|nr:Lpp/OprI family alanine-zipper lipoprotein [Ferrimonas sediminicola]TKB48139.1 hypothetical protein FCL40_13500 [Ferrimonas sediminicola]